MKKSTQSSETIPENRKKKINTVAALSDKIAKAKSIVFVDYTGIKHKQLEMLRKTLKKVEAEFIVTKNKLLERAFGTTASDMKSYFVGHTAALFNFQDEVAGLKELVKFFKIVTAGKTKGGILGKTILTDEEVTRLARIPARQQLLGQLAGQLIAPIQGLHRALQWNMNTLVWVLQEVKNTKST